MRAPSLRPVPPPRAEGAPLPSAGRAVARFPTWPDHFGTDGVDTEHVAVVDLLGDLRVRRIVAGRDSIAIEGAP